jgi:hypothetical protein
MRMSYGVPQLYIGGKEVTNISSVKVDEKGGTSINSLSASITDPEIDEKRVAGTHPCLNKHSKKI